MKLKRWISGSRQALQRLTADLYFVQTPVANPLGGLNSIIDGAKGLKGQAPAVSKGAQTACEAARQACKHVDVANKSNLTSGWPTFNPYQNPGYGYPRQPMPSYQLPPPEYWQKMLEAQQQAVIDAVSHG